MSTQSIVQGNNGKLNLDMEPAYINQGDYLDANNVRYFTREGQTTGSHENVYGNENVFDVESIAEQEKVYGIVEGTGSTTLTFYYSNGIEIGTTGTITDYASFQTEITTLFTTGVFSATDFELTFTTDGTSYYVGITPNDVDGNPLVGFDYSVTSSGANWYAFLSKEPIMAVHAGANKVIGSTNIDDDLFILSTPNEFPILSETKYEVTGISSSSPGATFTIVDANNDLASEGILQLYATDPQDFIEYSGQHVYKKDTSNSLIIYLVGYYVVNAPVGDVYVSQASIGYGTVGVARKNENDETWAYTRLLVSREFAFSTLYQADVIGEKNNRGVSIYWTDNFNVPRSFYYYGDYTTDGALNNVNSLNKYVIGSISKQTRLQYGYAGATIDYGGQDNGKLNCGNYRYAVRFTTKEGVSTNWSLLSNPFSTFYGDTPWTIYGGDADTNSGKSNIINVSWSDNNSYDYIQFCYVRFVEDATVGTGLFSTEAFTFGRTKLALGQTSITYTHDGYETDVAELGPISQLQNSTFVIKKAKNIRALDNRLILSNVNVAGNEASLVNLFDTITYSIEKKNIDSIGTFSPDNTLTQRLTNTSSAQYPSKIASIGEYIDPANTFKYVGYMMNETYRFYGVAEYLDGTLSDAYYLFDSKICTDSDFTGGGGSDPKRNASSTFIDYKLNTDATLTSGFYGDCTLDGAQTLIPYVNVAIPAVLPAINGIDAKKVINKIHIFRADVKEKTILANGLGTLGIEANSANTDFYDYNYAIGVTFIRIGGFSSCTSNDVNAGTIATGEGPSGYDAYHYRSKYSSFPFIADLISNEHYAPTVVNSLLYKHTPSYGYSIANRKSIEFYSQDHLLSNERIEHNNIDQIINYGHYDNYYYANSNTGYGYNSLSSYRNFHGFGSFYFCGPYGGSTYEQLSLDTSKLCGPAPWIDEKEYVKVDSTPLGTYSKLHVAKWTGISNGQNWVQKKEKYTHNKGHVFFTTSNVTLKGISVGRTVDYGTHLISYYRPLTPDQQYGNNNIGTLIPTGAYYDLQSDSTQLGTLATLNEINVFGGDTYTCKSLLRYRYTDPDNKDINGVPDGGRYGVGVEFYSQSRVNPQLRYNTEPQGATQNNKVWPFDFPTPQDSNKLQDWFGHKDTSNKVYLAETVSYNGSFSDKNTINSLAIYDPNIYYENKQPATVYYSEVKLQESLIDSYSYIKPTNRKDLDISFGDINHHEIYNGQLITFQERSMNRQFFNSTTMISNPDSQIVLGDGGQVLSRRGETLSTYGLRNKWSVVKGRSKGGNDVLYWYDATTRKIMRFAYDGVVPISVRANIDSFIWNNTGFIQMYDTPAHGEGVCGVWNEKYNEALFTFRAKKIVDTWNPDNTYDEGDVVFYTGNGYDEFHQTGEFFISNVNSNIDEPDFNIEEWTVIPHDNNDYYNEFTIVFSEDKNGFTTFYSPKPKIYMPFKDGYLTPYPVSEDGQEIYENDRGSQCEWYDGNLLDNAYIEGVINYNPELIKTAEAISIDSNTTPVRVDVRSAQHSTYMLSANNDFASVEGMYRTPVKNNATPDGDTTRVYGRWFGVKYTMTPGTRQAIRSFVLKIRSRNRMYNK
jgi:hypothetical protein